MGTNVYIQNKTHFGLLYLFFTMQPKSFCSMYNNNIPDPYLDLLSPVAIFLNDVLSGAMKFLHLSLEL